MRDFDPTASEFITSGYIADSRPGGKLFDPGTAMASAQIGSSLLGANAASDAADTQAAAADRATALKKEIFDLQRADQEPFRQAGLTAQNRLLDLLGLSNNTGAQGYGSLMRDFGMEDFKADPGYAFRLSEGQKALERGTAARGGLGGGRYMKDLTRFGQDNASQEYGNAFNRFQANRANKLNPLQAFIGQGQSATNAIGNAAGQYGASAGGNMIGAGNAQAAGRIGAANAITGGISQYQNSQFNNRLLGMLQRPGSGGYGGYGGTGNMPDYFDGTQTVY